MSRSYRNKIFLKFVPTWNLPQMLQILTDLIAKNNLDLDLSQRCEKDRIEVSNFMAVHFKWF